MHLFSRTLAAAAAIGLAVSAHAQLRITEVMSHSGSGGTNDWFELSNLGSSAVNIAGYRMDDNSYSFALSVALAGVATISPGESVVFLEVTSSDPAGDVASFRSFWGGTALPPTQVGYYLGSGMGVSFAATGDGAIVFDSGGATIDTVSFGAATSGKTFGYNPITNTFGGVSVVGQFGAFESANALRNVGSPGAVPEPAGLALIGLGALAIRRRRALV